MTKVNHHERGGGWGLENSGIVHFLFLVSFLMVMVMVMVIVMVWFSYGYESRKRCWLQRGACI